MNSPDKADLQHRESDFAEIFNNFKNRMVEIEFSRRELKTIHENALKEAIKNADYIKTISAKSDGIYNSLHSMFFSHPDTGALAPYGFKEQTPDEKIENIKIQLNKQYCWLLAEAYEEFEDFLEHVYARVGYLCPDAWPMTDFGGISIRDIDSKHIDWFINQSTAKKNGSRGIVNQLNKEFPEIKELCEKNKHLGNIAFQLTVIEKMRHIVVHNRGQVKDREKFTEVVLKDFGISTNGESADNYKSIINYYLATVKRSGEDIIYLLDRPIKGMEPLNATTPVFEHLVGLLLAFSLIVCRILRARVEKVGAEG